MARTKGSKNGCDHIYDDKCGHSKPNTQKICDDCNGFIDAGDIPKDEIAPDNWCNCKEAGVAQ